MEIEIEFKNILNKAQYEELLAFYNIDHSQIHRQVNHYFDTNSWSLKNHKAALRVRLINDYYQYTLKEATTTNISIETTDILSKKQVTQIMEQQLFPQGNVQLRLNELKIDTSDLLLFGTLTTDRVELPYKDGTLVFDHSFYLQQDDYEVEYETTNERQGLIIFEDFLNTHHIDKQTAPKKIARFMNALKKKG